jgi:hypothetical protein
MAAAAPAASVVAPLGGYCNGPADCDDANFCTDDTCNYGYCDHTPKSCSDNSVCTTDTCNPATGCVYTNNINPCDDNNACTSGDTCGGGSCNPGTPIDCDDGNPCTDDYCKPFLGCVHRNNTASCGEENACTTGDTCRDGTCHPGTAIVCNDNNPCTTDSCNPATGCVFANNTNPCDDGNACTTGDFCRDGICTGMSSGLNHPRPRPSAYYRQLCE